MVYSIRTISTDVMISYGEGGWNRFNNYFCHRRIRDICQTDSVLKGQWLHCASDEKVLYSQFAL